MGNQMQDCCNEALNGDATDLRHQTSASELLIEKAKQEEHTDSLICTKSKSSKPAKSNRYSFGIFTKDSALKLQTIDSERSTNHGLLQIIKNEKLSLSVSDDVIYSMESSESENDPTLSNDIIRDKLLSKHNQNKNKNNTKRASIKIPESSTTSADHKLEEAVISDTCYKQTKKPKNKYKEIMRAKNNNNKYSMGALKQELSECEIKLKQEQHEKDILKKENEALRAKIQEFHQKYGVVDSGFDFNELYIKGTLLTNASRSSSTEKGYQAQKSQELSQLLSPSQSVLSNNNNNSTPSSSTPATPMAINWSNSSNLDVTSPSNKSNNTINMNVSPPSNTNNNKLPNHYPSITSSPHSLCTNSTVDHKQETKSMDDETLIVHQMPTVINIPTTTTSDGPESGFSLNITDKTKSNSVPDFSQNTLSLDLLCIEDNHEEHSLEIDSCTPCGSIESCAAIKRIIDALNWYSISGDDHESVYKKMKTNNYGKRIVDDYNHIMEYHLDDNNNNNQSVDVRHEYDLIVAQVNKYVEPCTFVQCAGYRRYLRSRNENIHKAQTIHQHEVQMYVNTMDGIHCCFMHLAKSIQIR